jgi:RNA polymerase sigma-70 factor (ECF subfamily)
MTGEFLGDVTDVTVNDQAQFVALLEPERDALWRFASRMCIDKGAAEDCLQDATIVAFRKFDDFTLGTSFRAWMFRILTNTILNNNSKARRAMRQRAAPVVLDLVAAAEHEHAWEGVLDDPDTFLDQVSDPIRRAVRGLPTHERMVFLLRAAENFSYRDISETLQIPMGTVMSHLFRARGRLRELLTAHARDTGFVMDTP